MSCVPGSPKTGGRKRGVPNKKTQVFQEALDSHGIDVVSQLAEILPHLDSAKRADVLLHLLAYQFPKRKAVEITGQNGLPAPEVVLIQLPANGRERKVKAQ